MNDKLFTALIVLAVIASIFITLAIYGDPRCLVVECRLTKEIP